MATTTSADAALIFQKAVDVSETIAQRGIDAVNARADLIGGGRHSVIYIDSVNGDDDSTDYDKEGGTGVLTMAKAYALMPNNSTGTFILKNDYVFQQGEVVQNPSRDVFINGVNNYSLSFTPFVNTDVPDVKWLGARSIEYVHARKSAFLGIIGTEILLPSIPKNVDFDRIHEPQSTVFGGYGLAPHEIGLRLQSCHIVQPTDGYMSLLGGFRTNYSYSEYNCTFEGDMSGRYIVSVPAGALAKDYPHITSTRSVL